MHKNRSMPACMVMPVLAYPDVGKAGRWLCEAFGFELRLKIGNHRAQLGFGDGAIVITELKPGKPTSGQKRPFSVMVRVEDVDAHHHHALRSGARIVSAPANYPYGERQYSCRDIGGYCWTFSQSIADVAPEDWGGMALNPTGGSTQSASEA